MACTPAGVMEILRRSNIPIEGANAVVIGRSDIVGKPQALLLLHANATVTICHSKSKDLAGIARRADIIVAAIGKAAMVTPDFVRPGATVIDVGQIVVKDAAEAERIFANFPAKLRIVHAEGFDSGGRRASRRRGSRRRLYAGTRRRRAAHDRHADEQHGESRADAARSARTGCAAASRP